MHNRNQTPIFLKKFWNINISFPILLSSPHPLLMNPTQTFLIASDKYGKQVTPKVDLMILKKNFSNTLVVGNLE